VKVSTSHSFFISSWVRKGKGGKMEAKAVKQATTPSKKEKD
jgi:hypothetical protein